MKIPFRKISATGNDFVVIDHRHRFLSKEHLGDFAREICTYHTGIGADGVLLLENTTKADYRMHYFNSDGSRGEMCGNGARALAWFAHLHNLWDTTGEFIADDGKHQVFREKESFGVTLNVESAGQKVDLDDGEVGWMINTGVPHLVLFTGDVASENVIERGHRLRYDARFTPAGINVDFVQVNDDILQMRTYERGVEQETLACGTGVTAAALIAADKFGLSFPIQIHMPGGRLDVRKIEGEWSLWGSVEEVFTGKLNVMTRIRPYMDVNSKNEITAGE